MLKAVRKSQNFSIVNLMLLEWIAWILASGRMKNNHLILSSCQYSLEDPVTIGKFRPYNDYTQSLTVIIGRWNIALIKSISPFSLLWFSQFVNFWNNFHHQDFQCQLWHSHQLTCNSLSVLSWNFLLMLNLMALLECLSSPRKDFLEKLLYLWSTLVARLSVIEYLSNHLAQVDLHRLLDCWVLTWTSSTWDAGSSAQLGKGLLLGAVAVQRLKGSVWGVEHPEHLQHKV